MAIAKTGNIVGALSGNLGGVNFCNTRFGLTLRKPTPPPPAPTESQLHRQRAMQLCRQWWRDITEAQRNAWRTFASNTLLTNRLGSQRNLTAQQLFIRYNILHANVGVAKLADPPPLPISDWPTRYVFDAVAGVHASIWVQPSHAPDVDFFLVAGARPVTTHPINHFHRWFILGVFQTGVANNFDILPEFEEHFGTIKLGERIGAKVLLIDLASPRFTWTSFAATVV